MKRSLLRTLLRTLSLLKNPPQTPSKNPSKKHLPLKNLLRTLLRVTCCCVTPLVCTLDVKLGNENRPEVFLPGVFLHPLGSWTFARSGHGCLGPKCLFFQGSGGLPEAFDPGRPHEWRWDVRGISGPKTLSLGCFFFFFRS